MPRSFISSRFSRMINVLFTKRPLIPRASAWCSSRALNISLTPTLMPRLKTSYPLLVRMMSTRFLPMSCTSPLTVASTLIALFHVGL